MTAKEFCISHEPIAIYNLFAEDALLIHGIQYGLGDCVYLSHQYGSKTSYHKLKIEYSKNGEYIKFQKSRIYLNEFIKL